jgi:hypothetical protein
LTATITEEARLVETTDLARLKLLGTVAGRADAHQDQTTASLRPDSRLTFDAVSGGAAYCPVTKDLPFCLWIFLDRRLLTAQFPRRARRPIRTPSKTLLTSALVNG